MRQAPLAFLPETARAHGDAVALRFVVKRVVLVSHPELIQEVLVHSHRSFRKHFALRSAKAVLREGLLTSEGEHWIAHRRQAQPAFRAQRLERYAEAMVATTRDHLARWPVGTPFDAHAAALRLAAAIVSRCLFGSELGGDVERVERAMDELTTTFRERLGRMPPLPLWVPTRLHRRITAARAEIEAVLARMVARRRAEPPGDDLLSALVHASAEEGGGAFSDPDLRDQLVTLFFAGHETTANALSWTWWLLDAHPEAEARLAAEVAASPSAGAPTLDDLARMPYLDAVLMESMRLMPPAWIIGRESTEALSIGGIRLPPRTTVLMSQWVVHRDARWYPDPERFRPERWLDGSCAGNHPFAYFPFGGGPRVCIGDAFARNEAKLVLATVAARVRLRLAAGAVVVPYPTITLRPQHGIAMVAERR
jgi:cytochrome P450